MKQIAREIIDDIVRELYQTGVLSNLTRPLYIEKLLVRLLGNEWRHVGGDWSGWDVENVRSKARLEVKQSAARQTWTDGPDRKGKPTNPIFDIDERSGYFIDGSKWVASPGRPADLYVFAWNQKFLPKEEVDHTDPEQWEFYILAESQLPKGQKTIGLNSLKRLHPIVADHGTVRGCVQAALKDMHPLKAAAEPTATDQR